MSIFFILSSNSSASDDMQTKELDKFCHSDLQIDSDRLSEVKRFQRLVREIVQCFIGDEVTVLSNPFTRLALD